MTGTAGVGSGPVTGIAAPPRLVHVTTTAMSLDWLLRPQLEAFAAAGFEVIGVSGPGAHVAALREAGIRHVELPALTRALAPGRDIAAVRALGRVLRSLRPTIVHTHNPKPGVLGRPLARAMGVPVVVNTVHGLYAQPGDSLRRRGLVYGLERFAAGFSDMELVQNEEDLATLVRLGVPPGRLRLLGNGVDLGRFDADRVGRAAGLGVRAELGIAPDEVVVGVVGRLVREKGFLDVLEAAALLRRRCPHVRVLVVGPREPDKADAVDAGVLRRAAADGIVVAGERHDMDRVYAAMDVFVLASHREGFPRAAMEAAAMGLPVVATDVRGGRQVVEDGRTGFLVPVRDADALAWAIERLAVDPPGRRRMGRAGRAKAEASFDHRQVIDLTLGTYAELLAANAS